MDLWTRLGTGHVHLDFRLSYLCMGETWGLDRGPTCLGTGLGHINLGLTWSLLHTQV